MLLVRGGSFIGTASTIGSPVVAGARAACAAASRRSRARRDTVSWEMIPDVERSDADAVEADDEAIDLPVVAPALVPPLLTWRCAAEGVPSAHHLQH